VAEGIAVVQSVVEIENHYRRVGSWRGERLR
jgi:hypothetical protein